MLDAHTPSTSQLPLSLPLGERPAFPGGQKQKASAIAALRALPKEATMKDLPPADTCGTPMFKELGIFAHLTGVIVAMHVAYKWTDTERRAFELEFLEAIQPNSLLARPYYVWQAERLCNSKWGLIGLISDKNSAEMQSLIKIGDLCTHASLGNMPSTCEWVDAANEAKFYFETQGDDPHNSLYWALRSAYFTALATDAVDVVSSVMEGHSAFTYARKNSPKTQSTQRLLELIGAAPLATKL